jgi:hypothetical protein
LVAWELEEGIQISSTVSLERSSINTLAQIRARVAEEAPIPMPMAVS